MLVIELQTSGVCQSDCLLRVFVTIPELHAPGGFEKMNGTQQKKDEF